MAIRMITKDDLRAPAIDLATLEYLERLFPDRAPNLKDSIDEIRFKSGQVSVVRKLRSEYETQAEPAPASTQ